jgi:hypothetical protein
MLWHHAGAPAGTTAHRWKDGPAWLRGALDWAWSESVAAGHADRTFRPDGPITRAELARMIWARAGSPPTATSHPWVDGRPWVNPALDWIAESGLMTGWPEDATFRPDQRITRAEIARLLFRFDGFDAAAAADADGADTAPPVSAPPATVAAAPTSAVEPPAPTATTGTAPTSTSLPPPTVPSADLGPQPG